MYILQRYVVQLAKLVHCRIHCLKTGLMGDLKLIPLRCDVKLTDNQCRYMINYHYTMVYMEKILNAHFLDVSY